MDYCDLYIDNKFLYKFENTLAVSFEEILEIGAHDYFYYCEVINTETNIKNVEVSETKSFDVINMPTQVTFQINGVDFNSNDQDFYITSPCVDEGFSALGVEVGYQSRYNQGGIHWEKVENGLATFNTTSGTHEFCLFNGRVIVNEIGKTTNYNVQTAEGMVELGEIDIPNTINSFVKLDLEQFEVFNKSNPKAWGQTWTSIITGLILFVIGLMILLASAKSESKAGVLIGGLMVMVALGFEINGIAGIFIGI